MAVVAAAYVTLIALTPRTDMMMTREISWAQLLPLSALYLLLGIWGFDYARRRNSVLISLAENLFTHMRMIRRKTIVEKDRVERSIRDHMNIIEALEARDTARAEELVRNHALGLAEHVAKYADYLD